MALLAPLPFTEKLLASSTRNLEQNVIRLQAGSVEHRNVKGVNSRYDTIQIEWHGLTLSGYIQLEQFWDAHGKTVSWAYADDSFASEGSSYVASTFTINSDGTYTGDLGTNNWPVAGSASDFDVYLTGLSGDAVIGGPFNQNINLGSGNVSVTLERTTPGTSEATFTLQIRDAGTSNVRASGTVDLTAEIGGPL